MLDAYIDDFGNPQNGRRQRWDYVNENPTTFWVHLKGWNDGDGEFGWYMWITAAVSLFSGFAFYIKAVNTSKFFAVFSYVQIVILFQNLNTNPNSRIFLRGQTCRHNTGDWVGTSLQKYSR